MNKNDVPRVAAPLIVAAAILLSFQLERAPRPIALQPVDPPPPSADSTRAGLERALAPGAPGFDRGAARSPVTVLEFADFGCPYCAKFATETYPPLAAEFVKTGLVRWRYVPFVLGIFTNGDEAARAAECAGEQGQAAFARMHDRLFAAQDEWKEAADPEGLFRSFASGAGLNAARFASCYAGDSVGQRVAAANALADQLGVRATPTFFINGERVEGSLPLDQFRAVLMDALRPVRKN
jgi:protein-disulfide isomerase